MIFNEACGINKTRFPPIFSITVNGSPAVENRDYCYAEQTQSDGTVNWELALLVSCEVTFSRVVPVDLFLVGGGKPGGTGGIGSSGAGGAGGERVTQSGVKLIHNSAYSVTVGGSNQSTAGFGYTAASGGGSNGGLGAYVDEGQNRHHAGNGVEGETAFGAPSSLISSLSGRKYGAGAGGGAFQNEAFVNADAGSGAATGGGNGGTLSSMNGKAGGANTGSGGGGAARSAASGTVGSPGAGGSGIVIVRNARGA